MVSEIVDLVGKRGIKQLIFYDDAFFPCAEGMPSRLSQICQLIFSSGLEFSWQIELRPDVLVAMEEEMMEQLHRAGCQQVNLGIEHHTSAQDSVFGKGVDHDSLRVALWRLRDACPTMRVSATFILGGPEETRDTVAELVGYACSLPLLFVHFCPLEVYPGTKLALSHPFSNWGDADWRQAILAPDRAWGEIIYQTPQLSESDLLSLSHMAYARFYSRQEWHEYARQILEPDEYNQAIEHILQWTQDRFSLNR